MNNAIQEQKPQRGGNVYSFGGKVEKSRVAAATLVLIVVAGANALYILLYLDL